MGELVRCVSCGSVDLDIVDIVESTERVTEYYVCESCGRRFWITYDV